VRLSRAEEFNLVKEQSEREEEEEEERRERERLKFLITIFADLMSRDSFESHFLSKKVNKLASLGLAFSLYHARH